MKHEQLSDLDELVLRCRTARAKSQIAEAVGSYWAGSFRSAIVATWIAVVFDFIDKLEELELTNDPNAKKLLTELESIYASGDVKASLDFERKVLDRAKDTFELISPIEYESLQRLFEDRHKCAHPSLNNRGEAYTPSAELARLHLRNAVTALLEHPPVQGKSALDRLVKEVGFDTFPTEVKQAVTHFQSGPLARPRESLVRNFVIVLLKHLFLDRMPDSERSRNTIALEAVIFMFRGIAERTIREKINDLARGDNDQVRRGVHLLAQVPEIWDFLNADVRNVLRNYVQTIPQMKPETLAASLAAEPLRDIADGRVQTLSDRDMLPLVKYRYPSVVARAIDLYVGSKSFDQGNYRAENLIIPLCPTFTRPQIEAMLNAAATNIELRHGFSLKPLLQAFYDCQTIPVDELTKLCTELALPAPWLEELPEEEVQDEEDIPF